MKISASAPGLLLIAGGLVLLALAALQFFQASLPVDEQASALIAPRATLPFTPAATRTAIAFATSSPTSPPVTSQQAQQAEPTAVELVPTVPPPPPTLPPVGRLSKPVRVVIPQIGVDSTVVAMSYKLVPDDSGQLNAIWNVPDSQVGHAINSANPGENGNVVLSGHNNLFARVFRKLYTLKPGDEITLYNAVGQAFLYRVNQSYIVPEAGASEQQRLANAGVLLPTSDARLTLTSCWPETSNTHRAIVIAALEGQAQ